MILEKIIVLLRLPTCKRAQKLLTNFEFSEIIEFPTFANNRKSSISARVFSSKLGDTLAKICSFQKRNESEKNKKAVHYLPKGVVMLLKLFVD